jgi:bifunctional UDP-N-acetylglucosamine pyrophosphorylase/glucosamine-1-phosphate N-acetyltransferase
VEAATVGDGCDIGPFAHLRPGTRLAPGVHVGNFVEIKNSTLAGGVRVGHVSYLGDADVGAEANIGAGTVTCNYDGREKHRTRIGAGAFIGSDTMLVAPVEVGDGARTGAGSVVTRDVPPGETVVGVPARRRPPSDG